MPVKEYYDQKGLSYTSTSAAAPEFIRNFYVRLAGKCGTGRVIDVGCGFGEDATIAETCGHVVVGVDPSPGSLDVFRSANRIGVEGDVLHLSDNAEIRKITDADGLFDAAFCGFVLIHVDLNQGRQAVAQLRSVLREGATILLATRVCDGPSQEMFIHAHRNKPGLKPTAFYDWPVRTLRAMFQEYFELTLENREGDNIYLEGRALGLPKNRNDTDGGN